MSAIATICAALITACISLVTLTLSKEQKTSEFRQAWIDALREDLAAFFSAARAFARSAELQIRQLTGQQSSATHAPFSQEKISEFRHIAAESFYKIKLQLNPNESEHKELLRLVKVAIDQQNRILTSSSSDIGEVFSAIDRASDYACPVLKSEWTRVKTGEPAFRYARNFFIFLIIITAIAFFAFLFSGKIQG